MTLGDLFETVAKPGQTGFIRHLFENGYDHINHHRNTFAQCFVKPEDTDVIIVNIEQDNAPRFYQMCLEQPDNPYLPTVHDIKNFSWGTVVHMERLVALDHLEVSSSDHAFLEKAAPQFISYIRGETPQSEMDEISREMPVLEHTARDILNLSKEVFKNTKGSILPFCDLKLDNIFLRKIHGENQIVFGDPLYPGSGKNADNMSFMQNAYKRFDLPPLDLGLNKEPSLSL